MELKDKFDVLVMDPNNDMNEEESEDYGNRMNILTDELYKIKDQKKEFNEIVKGNKNEIYQRYITPGFLRLRHLKNKHISCLFLFFIILRHVSC